MALTSDRIKANQLRILVHSLPQELYDTIYNLVFTPHPSMVEIDEDHKPPPQLSVDRQSRHLFAYRYYGSPNGFHFQADDRHLVCKWLVALEAEHIDWLQIVDYDSAFESVPSFIHNEDDLRRMWRELYRKRVSIYDDVVSIDYFRDLEEPTGQEVLESKEQRARMYEPDIFEGYEAWALPGK